MQLHTHATGDSMFPDSDDIRQQRGWFVALAVLMTALGLGAIAFPLSASVAVTLLVGVVLVIAGIGQLLHALRVSRWPGFLITLLSALLSLAVGTLVLLYPLSGVLSLTLLVGTFLLVGGTLKIILAFRVRPGLSWQWLLFAGGLAVLLGVLILLQWPVAAGWVLGVLIGIDLLFSGLWMLTLTLATRDGTSGGAQRSTLSETNARRRSLR
jgi:uncharacterized membrane protein HdeD (DUF308 family)